MRYIRKQRGLIWYFAAQSRSKCSWIFLSMLSASRDYFGVFVDMLVGMATPLSPSLSLTSTIQIII